MIQYILILTCIHCYILSTCDAVLFQFLTQMSSYFATKCYVIYLLIDSHSLYLFRTLAFHIFHCKCLLHREPLSDAYAITDTSITCTICNIINRKSGRRCAARFRSVHLSCARLSRYASSLLLSWECSTSSGVGNFSRPMTTDNPNP